MTDDDVSDVSMVRNADGRNAVVVVVVLVLVLVVALVQRGMVRCLGAVLGPIGIVLVSVFLLLEPIEDRDGSMSCCCCCCCCCCN